MIKKINIFMIVITLLGSLYFAIIKANDFVFIIKNMSIILSINALYIIQKIFKIRINESINFIYILFIFIAHFLGVIVNLYDEVYWYDKFVHFSSGIVSTLAAVYILIKSKQNKNIILNVIFMLSFAMLIASVWEIFEYLSSLLFNVDPQKVISTGVADTMGDIIIALFGSILISICYCFEHSENHNLLIKKFEKLV